MRIAKEAKLLRIASGTSDPTLGVPKSNQVVVADLDMVRSDEVLIKAVVVVALGEFPSGCG